MKLNGEETEDLQDLLSHPGMKVLWKCIDDALRAFEESVLKYDLSSGNPTELSHIKCRAEGAARIVAALKQRLQVKPTPKKRVAT